METNREYWEKRLRGAQTLATFENVMLEYNAWLQKKCDDQRRDDFEKDCVSCQYFQNCRTKWLNEEREHQEGLS